MNQSTNSPTAPPRGPEAASERIEAIADPTERAITLGLYYCGQAEAEGRPMEVDAAFALAAEAVALAGSGEEGSASRIWSAIAGEAGWLAEILKRIEGRPPGEDRCVRAESREQFATVEEAWEYLLADYESKFPGWEAAKKKAEREASSAVLDSVKRTAAEVAQLPRAERERAIAQLTHLATIEAPPEELDAEASPAVEAIRKVLFEDTQDAWDATGPAREEIPGSSGLLHRGIPVTFYGPRGQGKSTVALTLALSAVDAGERGAYFDRENGAGLNRNRLMDALAARAEWSEEAIRPNFSMRVWPQLRADWSPDDFGAAIEAEGFSFVVFDSVREMLHQLGLSEDSASDYSRLHDLLGSSLASRGITPVFLDNVGLKDGKRPRGSSSKLDATPQGFQVVTVDPFSPVATGTIKIVCTRSRYGDENRAWRMMVGGGKWGLPQWDGSISKLLTHLPDDGQWHPGNELADALGVTRQTARAHYFTPAEEAGAVEIDSQPGRPLRVKRLSQGVLPI